jgi:hypothetical protein
MAAKVQDPDLAVMSAGDLLSQTSWEQIEADGVITLDEIERALESEGYSPDSHDHLHE